MSKPPFTTPARVHAPPASAASGWWGRPWSLERKLPLLMTGLLVVVLAAVLGLTHATLTESATASATARLQRAADQLASLAQASTARTRARLDSAAADAALREALVASAAGAGGAYDGASPGLAAARASLERLLSPRDTGLAAELWAADGQRLAFAGRDRGNEDTRQPLPPETARRAVLPPGLDALQASDSVQMGALYLVGGVPHFWVVAPVVDRGAHVGYLARQYRIAEGARADQTIRGLTGADVASYYRNADGNVWTTISGGSAAAPAARDSSGGVLIFARPGVGDMLAVEEPIPGTPLVLVLERPLQSVLAPQHATLRRLALLCLVVLLVGAAAAWLLSRRITRPLVALTDAAEAMARGDYATRVAPAGDEELRRLTSSFNHMAGEVGASRGELEMQTEEAQALAEELEQTNQELADSVHTLEEREAQFRALADAIPQLAWMAHADGSIFWYNERWYAYTGTTPSAMQGWGWQSVHDPAMLPDVLGQWNASLAAGTPFEMEFPLRGADGRFRWFLTRAQPLRGGQAQAAVRWFGTCTDVQALRDARQAAEAARADAEQARARAEASQLAAQDARAAAEAASRAKSEFLAVMSHELRTPLNAIGGYTDLLDLGIRGPVTDAQRRDLARIRTSQQHLLGLISGVLDLSRIEAGRVAYDLVPIALNPFLAGLDGLVAPQAAAKSLALGIERCDERLGVTADREKLRQILLNLLSNAIRYTPLGGRIDLAARAVDDGRVAITVRDTGVGIAADALQHIFEPFVQLDRSLTQVRDGVGLGLAISRDLARGMAGDLTVASAPGEGSCFTLTLPRAGVEEGAVSTGLESGEYPAARSVASS